MSTSGSGGKVNRLRVYLECNLFDTPENRVITSGLTWLRFVRHFD